jgi:hypothetical protein
VLTLSLAAPTGARADMWYGSDPTSDVMQTVHARDPEPCGTDTVMPTPDDTTHDITQLQVRHGLRTAFITLRLRDLLASGRHFTTVTLRTDGGVFWLDALRFANGHVDFDLVRKPRHLPPPDECGNVSVLVEGRQCLRLTGRWDADDDLIRFAVPRSCVGDPEWVSASASVYSFRQHNGIEVFLDDRWQPSEGWGYFTPRVHRS